MSVQEKYAHLSSLKEVSSLRLSELDALFARYPVRFVNLFDSAARTPEQIDLRHVLEALQKAPEQLCAFAQEIANWLEKQAER
jgi:hypothetical protein